ncbi:MAG: site-specific DNA-methyltransferase, partial [Endozoicomonadaceae bacterium]|nr:site-specific DNA-methyltransferase [Endozoicomonadaceae bacterium]
QHNPRGRNDDKFYGTSHEYMIVHAKDREYAELGMFNLSENDKAIYNKSDNISNYHEVSYMRTGNNSDRNTRPNLFYPIYVDVKQQIFSLDSKDGFEKVLPINSSNEEKTWRWEKETFLKKSATELSARKTKNIIRIYKKRRLENVGKKPKTVWFNSKYDASSNGIMYLRDFLGKQNEFSYPKSIHTVQDTLYISADKSSTILDYFAGSGTTGHAVINLNRADDGQRKYIMVEMGHYFDTVTKPRMQKVIYSKDWKEGKPLSREGSSHCFKTIRLESYEDTLNNLSFKNDDDRDHALRDHADFRRDYMLQYWLDFETKDSPSLLNIEQFHDPAAYQLNLKKPGSDAYEQKTIDLLETLNWLIGLQVTHLDKWRGYTGKFKRELDPELPKENDTRLILDGQIAEADDGRWQLRKVAGRVCRSPGDMDNTDQVLVIWRKLTDNMEKDNLMLDEWFKQYRTATKTSSLDVIYVNGSNNLASLQRDDEHWQVRLTEAVFHQKMWDF